MSHSTLRKAISVAISIGFLFPMLLLAAVRGHDTMFVSGTVSTVKAGTKGKLDVSDPKALTFTGKDDDKQTLTIPYNEIEAMDYGEHAGRRVGATIALGVTTLGLGALPVLFSKKKRHYLTIYFNQDLKAAAQQRDEMAKNPNATAKGDVVVFEINKHDYANVIEELQARTGVKVAMEQAKR